MSFDIKRLWNKYKTVRNSEDATMLGVNFSAGLKLFNKNDTDNPKWTAGTGTNDKGFAFYQADIQIIIVAFAVVVTLFTAIHSLIGAFRYKKRF